MSDSKSGPDRLPNGSLQDLLFLVGDTANPSEADVLWTQSYTKIAELFILREKMWDLCIKNTKSIHDCETDSEIAQSHLEEVKEWHDVVFGDLVYARTEYGPESPEYREQEVVYFNAYTKLQDAKIAMIAALRRSASSAHDAEVMDSVVKLHKAINEVVFSFLEKGG